MAWAPLLDGSLADTALDAVRDVARALAAAPHPTASPADRTTFWAYASHVIDEPFAHAAYDAALDELVAELAAGARHLSLYGGLAGIGWTLCHVLDDPDDALAPIDEALAGVLAIDPWPGAHDLVEGLVGVGVYFLERIAHAGAHAPASASASASSSASSPAPLARDGLARVVAHLDATATRTELGATWLTSPALLPPFLAAEWPDGFFDVGVAHGVPGMIAMLDRAARLPDAPARARPLRDEALRWVAVHRRAQDPGGDGRFPTKLGRGPVSHRSRAAWCYGDPGIAAALWNAAPELARETALESARRPAETCRVRDAGLCHGAAGLAHLFNRFFQATGEPAFAEAARGWFARALAMRHPDGVGGFVAHRGGADDPLQLAANGSLLEGAIGVGLALLAAISPSEPSWDRLLLCDLPLLPAAATTTITTAAITTAAATAAIATAAAITAGDRP